MSLERIIKNLTPKSPYIWFMILWLGGLFSCLALASAIKMILPKNPKPYREIRTIIAD